MPRFFAITSSAFLLGCVALLGVTPLIEPTDDLGVIPGVARPVHDVIKTAPVDGVIMELRCAEGDLVKAGDPLAILDNRVAVAAVAAARAATDRIAAIDMAKRNIEFARRHLDRVEEAAASQASNATEVDEARAELARAEAALAMAIEDRTQARLNLALEEAKLEQHVIRAPFDGRVVRVLSDLGATVTPSTPILQIVAMDTLVIELPMPARCYGSLQEGQYYELHADDPVLTPLACRLRVQGQVIDSASGTFRCVFDVPNGSGTLPAGFSVRPRMLDGRPVVATPDPGAATHTRVPGR